MLLLHHIAKKSLCCKCNIIFCDICCFSSASCPYKASKALCLKVLTQRNLKQSLVERISVAEPPFEEHRGTICDTSLDRWKARRRLPTVYNWTHYASSYCWGSVRENASKLAFDKGCRVTFTANVNTPSNRKMVLLQRYPWKFSHKETL